MCDHSRESSRAVLSCDTVNYAIKANSNFSNESSRAVLLCGTVYYAVQVE